MAEIGEILNVGQMQALNNHTIYTKEDVRGQSDEQLLSIEGIGVATVKKLRGVSARPEVVDGDAISLKYLVIRKGDKKLSVSPGDVIPAEFDARTRVEQGKARWRISTDV